MTERVALVVGASRGLGLGLTGELAGRGWHVIATARNPATADGLRQLQQASAGRVEVERLDVDSPEQLEALAGRLSGRRFDLLFHNAGVAGPKHQSVDAVTAAELAALFTTNAIAPLRIARRLLPQVKDGGTVAFMSSRMGSVADNRTGGFDLYRASKAALNSLTRGFASAQVGERPITVLTLHPGWVRTDMGGSAAPVSVADSVRGLADVLEARHTARHSFLDYQGTELPW